MQLQGEKFKTRRIISIKRMKKTQEFDNQMDDFNDLKKNLRKFLQNSDLLQFYSAELERDTNFNGNQIETENKWAQRAQYGHRAGGCCICNRYPDTLEETNSKENSNIAQLTPN